ncbi:MAG: winged helix DNA-binding domain-containing protein, partial [Acidobacteriota bacterium]|nr:winged helix DNA-binding domain-containing protein [Acidobacteriota bacterium]
RRESHRVRPWGFESFLESHRDYANSVLEEVRARGPLTAEDLPEPDGGLRRMVDRWGFGMAVKKSVLEAHFGFGRLVAVDRRSNFARAYDLPERVVPSRLRRRRVGREDAQRELLLQAARSHGIAALADLSDYYRMSARDARPRLAELVEAGKLHEVRVEGWRQPALLHPEARTPRAIDAAALLSPFDPVVWTRPRARRLFEFDYRVEIFVPKEKRRWGYYVLPFLLGDRLVARVDLKADRKQRRLHVLAAYLEPGQASRAVTAPLAKELRSLASWLQLDEVRVGRRGDLARPLAAAVRPGAHRRRR